MTLQTKLKEIEALNAEINNYVAALTTDDLYSDEKLMKMERRLDRMCRNAGI